jgi:lipoic acid synthetase
MTTAKPITPKPKWLKIRLNTGGEYQQIKHLINDLSLHTVCQEARCPNIYECWSHGTATFMISGESCTRRCGFCAVSKGAPVLLDSEEPRHVAEAVRKMGVKHAVITSVNRDDLPDGAAAHWVATINAVRALNPNTKVEVLTPDFEGNTAAMDMIFAARPDVMNHNTETVPRLYRRVRPHAKYHEWTMMLLERAGKFRDEHAPQMLTKSGVMVGLGETTEEIIATMRDLRSVNCDILTIGQYLQPAPKRLKVEKYYTPDEFAAFKTIGLEMGFRYVESGPLVRSSYHAHEHTAGAQPVAANIAPPAKIKRELPVLNFSVQ